MTENDNEAKDQGNQRRVGPVERTVTVAAPETCKAGDGQLHRLVRVLRRRAAAICAEHLACEREIARLERRKKKLFAESQQLWKDIERAEGKHPNVEVRRSGN